MLLMRLFVLFNTLRMQEMPVKSGRPFPAFNHSGFWWLLATFAGHVLFGEGSWIWWRPECDVIGAQVHCTECDHISSTVDPCLDISLEIARATSLERALHRFTAGEVLQGDNAYRCPRQGRLTRATKRITIDCPPPVLVLQLKRFEFSMFGHKIDKKVCPMPGVVQDLIVICHTPW